MKTSLLKSESVKTKVNKAIELRAKLLYMKKHNIAPYKAIIDAKTLTAKQLNDKYFGVQIKDAIIVAPKLLKNKLKLALKLSRYKK
jgi:hypothetical protein